MRFSLYMRINGSNSYSNVPKVSKPTFKAWHREVYKTVQQVDFTGNIPEIQFTKVLKYRNDTYIYRDFDFWKNLADFLVDKYKAIQKVNVFDYACSNGSEAYTFVMQMLSNFKKATADKFLPVIAKDCDPLAIKKAKSGKLPISEDEEKLINQYTKNQFGRFIGKCCETGEQGSPLYEVRDELTNSVVFSEADILEDLDKLPKSNNVVFARNFWPYLSNTKRNDLAEKLYEYIGENSVLVVGNYDYMRGDVHGSTVQKLLFDAGFKEVFSHELFGFVYEK